MMGLQPGHHSTMQFCEELPSSTVLPSCSAVLLCHYRALACHVCATGQHRPGLLCTVNLSSRALHSPALAWGVLLRAVQRGSS
jgi:hypothetical protein